MALVLEDGAKVWRKVDQALTNAGPEAQRTFKGLRDFLVQQKGNPTLQFLPFSAAQAIAAGGTDLVGAASTVYGWYAKAARTTGTTSSFLALHAAADNTATTTTLVTDRIKLTGQRFSYVTGFGLAAETGLTISAATAVGGATESAEADAANGFVIVGAA